MSGSFAQLLQVAKANSASSNREAQEALKRREDALKKAREEQERKERDERELQKRLVLKKLNDQKQEEERRKQKDDELKKRKEELAKKKEAEALASKSNSGGSSSASGSRASKPSNGYIVRNSSAMTREEKRMARDPLFADRVKRSGAGTKKRRDGRLPGGAIDGSGDSNAQSSGNNSMSARARMAANFAPTLTKLNTEKRDLRSIDEISRDVKRKHGVPVEDNVLKGDDAAEFSNWFGSKKDHSTSGSPSPRPSAKPTEKTKSSSGLQSSASSKAVQRPGAPGKSTVNGSSKLNPYASGGSPSKKNGPATALGSKFNAKPGYSKTAANGHSYSAKRSREESEDDYDSDDDYDSEDDDRYRGRSGGGGGGGLNDEQRREIWKLMGKNRDAYTSRNVDSDDDMEVTGWELEREERISARLAKQEDDEAEAEDKRREMEKKRRKLEKSRA